MPALTPPKNWSICTDYWLSKGRHLQQLDECFAEIVHQAKEHVASNHHEPGCKLFFEINGRIGFAPKGTQEGDLICQFRNSDVIAVIRRDFNRYDIIGRAVEFLAEGGRSQPCRWGEDAVNSGYDVPARPIELWMDI